MNNRRENYRHSFRSQREVCIDVQCGETRVTLHGDLCDLSVEGMCVRLQACPLEVNDLVLLRPKLPLERPARVIPASVIRVEQVKTEWQVGFVFMPDASLERERKRFGVLWRFLLDEQRRFLRTLAVEAETPRLAIYTEEQP